MNSYDYKDAEDFHESTKHSEVSIQLSRHRLDWRNKPRPFKFYTNLPPLALPPLFPMPKCGTLRSISTGQVQNHAPEHFDLKDLAEILFFSAGITRRMKYDSNALYMRAAPATGALYPIELYLVCGQIAELIPGVYHFNPGEFSLTKLREGDYRTQLSEAAGDDKNILDSPCTIIFSSIAWRNAWKYQDRSYRHWFWDSGVIASNLLAVTACIGLQAHFNLGFVDNTVNKLLCLEDRREASIALVSIGLGLSKNLSSTQKEFPVLYHETINSNIIGEVQYPSIWKVHEASYLNDKDQVKNWKSKINTGQIRTQASPIITDSIPLPDTNYPTDPQLGDVILLRGSSRQFLRKPISLNQLTNILQASTTEIPLDVTYDGKYGNTEIYFIANDVEGLTGGSYYYNNSTRTLDKLKKSVSREVSGYLCLWQSLFSDASVVFFLMAPLKRVLESRGNRGYRATQFEAGVIAGKIYLASYAQAMGASGSTFFDDAVTEFFSPHAQDKSTMIAVGVGIPGYKSKSGQVLAGKFSRNQLITEAL
jgi:SagB-type dehydrogenase family enzyme